MRIILLGPPGSGKGSQAEWLQKELCIPHISTGEIFRREIKANSELGKNVQEYVEKGLLVPDDVVLKLIKKRIRESDCVSGFILDGFPRTLNQAQQLDILLKELACPIDKVIYIKVDFGYLRKRLTGRRVCSNPNCGAIYNIYFNPPKEEGKCDRCGSVLIQRPDDDPVVVDSRLRKYGEETIPLLEYYRSKNLLVDVSGEGTPEEIHRRILSKLKE